MYFDFCNLICVFEGCFLNGIFRTCHDCCWINEQQIQIKIFLWDCPSLLFLIYHADAFRTFFNSSCLFCNFLKMLPSAVHIILLFVSRKELCCNLFPEINSFSYLVFLSSAVPRFFTITKQLLLI